MNNSFPVAVEVLLCAAAIAAMVGMAYLVEWVHRVMSARFPKSPVAVPASAEERPRDATLFIEGPLIMSAPDRPFNRTREPQ